MFFFAACQAAIDFGQLHLRFSFSQRVVERRAVNFLLPVGEITGDVFLVHEAIIQDRILPETGSLREDCVVYAIGQRRIVIARLASHKPGVQQAYNLQSRRWRLLPGLQKRPLP